MKFEAEIIKEIVDRRGHEKTSIHYQSECIEKWVKEVEGAYPKLCDYQPEWLNYSAENNIGVFPYVTLTDVTSATVENVVPYAYKTAILKGSTKYRDIDTGEFLDVFEDGRNLELVSVKMPGLTTTGKNVFDGKFIKYNSKYGQYRFGNGIYTYSITDNDISVDLSNVSFGDADNNSASINWLINNGKAHGNKRTITNRILVFYPNNEETFNKIKQRYNIQIEEDTQATSYEPFKSNILTVNESIELRGIGNVKDEMDCLTGELTQRIGEIVLNGSENWAIENPLSNDEYIYFKLNDTNTIKSNVSTSMVVNVLTDKLKISSYAKEASTKSNSYFQAWTSHFIGISRTELSTQDVVGFKEWLSNNNISIQYPLSEKSIKTVDLSVVDQDGKSLEKIKPLEGSMHLNTTGESIKPLFSGEIPVEAMTQNLASFIEE